MPPSIAAFAIVRVCAQSLLSAALFARPGTGVPWWMPGLAASALLLLGVARHDEAHLRGRTWSVSDELLLFASGAAAALLVTFVELGWQACMQSRGAAGSPVPPSGMVGGGAATSAPGSGSSGTPVRVVATFGTTGGATMRTLRSRQGSPVSSIVEDHSNTTPGVDGHEKKAAYTPSPVARADNIANPRGSAECLVDCVVWAFLPAPAALIIQPFVGIVVGMVVPGSARWAAHLSMNVSVLVYFVFVSTRMATVAGGARVGRSPNIPYDVTAMILSAVCMLGAMVLSRAITVAQRDRADQVGSARV